MKGGVALKRYYHITICSHERKTALRVILKQNCDLLVMYETYAKLIIILSKDDAPVRKMLSKIEKDIAYSR